jgi:cyanophycinase-like exopeptidase
MKTHPFPLVCLFLGLVLAPAALLRGQDLGGHLLIVGGGLRPNNQAVYQRMVDYAGGAEKARIGVLPTASAEPSDAVQLQFLLGKFGVPADRVQLIDIRIGNAATTAHDTAVVARPAPAFSSKVATRLGSRWLPLAFRHCGAAS